MVEILMSDLSLRRSVHSCLKAVPDYFRLAKKIHRGKGTLQVMFPTPPSGLLGGGGGGV